MLDPPFDRIQDLLYDWCCIFSFFFRFDCLILELVCFVLTFEKILIFAGFVISAIVTCTTLFSCVTQGFHSALGVAERCSDISKY